MTIHKSIAVGTNDSVQSQAAVLRAARRAQAADVPLAVLPVVDDRRAAALATYSGKASMVVMGSVRTHLGCVLADRALQVAATAAKVPVAVAGTAP
jgi:hypothetical protein